MGLLSPHLCLGEQEKFHRTWRPLMDCHLHCLYPGATGDTLKLGAAHGPPYPGAVLSLPGDRGHPTGSSPALWALKGAGDTLLKLGEVHTRHSLLSVLRGDTGRPIKAGAARGPSPALCAGVRAACGPLRGSLPGADCAHPSKLG